MRSPKTKISKIIMKIDSILILIIKVLSVNAEYIWTREKSVSKSSKATEIIKLKNLYT